MIPSSAGGFQLYESNRMERLADALVDVVRTPCGETLAPECLVVPGHAVSRWLTLELSQRFGVWSNALYLYPQNFMRYALERVLGPSAECVGHYQTEQLFWSILATLQRLLPQPGFEAVRRYVEGDESQTRYFGLCKRIARTFERYLTYRPDLLRSWERDSPGTNAGDDAQLALFDGHRPSVDWQPILWRALVEKLGKSHPAALETKALRRLSRNSRPSGLPARICCFGVTCLPPSYARVLAALGRHVPIYFFQLQAASRPARVRAASHDAASSNSLLSSTGQLAREFEGVLSQELQRQGVRLQSTSLHEDPGAASRLSRLQQQLLHHQPPPGQTSDAASDESITVHACHSAMREVEVLHDQLLSLLAHDTGTRPEDVVVMSPNIERYAPLIEAVFRRPAQTKHRIPYCIADRAPQATASVMNGLRRLLGLVGERLSASQVLDLLSLEVVAARFEFNPRDVETAGELLGEANVRWGIDAEHRRQVGHPASDENTWREGLRRLLVGYATESRQPELCLGVLPAGSSEGGRAELLGKLCHFVETLFSHLANLSRHLDPQTWQRSVGAAVEALFVSDAETDWQHQEIRAALAQVVARAEAAGFDAEVTSPALCDLLFEAVAGAQPARGFMSGGVTFCSMVALRAVPFRVVGLLGMSDHEFPRSENPPDFDRMAHDPSGPRVGDRSRRSDDRYLFLETLLSARERLIVTYTGQSIRDNAELPPSVLIAELCDYLSVERSGDQAAAAQQSHLTLRHPLQAFSHRYFDGRDERLFSYETSYLPPAAGSATRGPLPIFSERLSRKDPDPPLELSELIQFFRNPTAYLFQRRLGVSLRENITDVPDREPLELSPLERHAVGQRLLNARVAGLPAPRARELLRAARLLPAGALGDAELRATEPLVESIARLALESAELRSAQPRRVSGVLAGRTLAGPLETSDGLVDYQFARVRAKHLLGAWIRHLFICWQAPRRGATSSIVGRSLKGDGLAHYRLPPVQAAEECLEQLVRVYDEGQRRPVPLFPDASLAYARSLAKKPGQPLVARLAASRDWIVELERDAHLQRAYGRNAPLPNTSLASSREETEFGQLASDVLQPLLLHLEEVAP